MTTHSQYRKAAEALLGLSGVKNPAPELLVAVANADSGDISLEDHQREIGHEFLASLSAEDPREICSSIFQRIMRGGMPEDATTLVCTTRSALYASNASDRDHARKMGAFFLAATKAWTSNFPLASAG